MQELSDRPVLLHQRCQPAPDAHVAPHLWVAGVLGVHEVPLVDGHHLEGQLVVVAQEKAPLAGLGDGGSPGQDLRDRQTLVAPQGHEHAGHQREVKAHVALVTLAEVVNDVGWPLVGLGEQNPPGKGSVHLGAQPLEEGVGLRQVLAVRAVPFAEVGHGVETEAVEADLEPEGHHVEHGLLHLEVGVVEVGLEVEEPVPVVLLALAVPRPVGPLGVDEDDAGLGPAPVIVGPHVPVSLGVDAVPA